jgi:sugar lactone lactonase YvrE
MGHAEEKAFSAFSGKVSYFERGTAVHNLVTVVEGLAFGEGPRWHGGRLYLSDMHANRVLTVGDDGVEVVATHSGALSGLGWLPDGRLLVVAMEGWVLRLEDDELVPHADLRAWAPHEINDMIVHPQGWAWVGQFGYDFRAGRGAEPVGSALLRVDPDGSVSEAAPDLLIANGMAITPGGDELLVAESRGRCITRFAVGADGTLRDRQLFADLGSRAGPDGICLDAEGALWVACPQAGYFARVRRGGEVTDRIELPEGRYPIACVLGGPDRTTLYLLSATTLGEAEVSRERRSGWVQCTEVAVPGAGRP